MTSPAAPAHLPLRGVRVLDLSRLLPGPYCTLIWAQMGADVVKIERPGAGDYARVAPPHRDGRSLAFEALNAGKRSVALDLGSPPDRERFLALAARAHVVLESFRPGVMERLGCGYEQARAANPALIWCAITGYGPEGARAQRAGHDINYLALSGVASLAPGPGAPVGFQAADIAGGALWASTRTLAALIEARQTGRGARIDVSMTAGVSALAALAQAAASAGEPPLRAGEGKLGGELACYRNYATADGGAMALGALEPKFWREFCVAVDRPDWVAAQYARGARQARLVAEVEALFASAPRAHWEARFADRDACCEPVLDLAEARARAAQAGEAWGAAPSGAAPGWALLPDLTGGGGVRDRGAPALGEHDAVAVIDEWSRQSG